jgi:hypothetical protein
MSNNYDDGYQAGVRGEQFTGSGVQAYAGYAAGKEARQRGQPQTHVDGAPRVSSCIGYCATACESGWAP